MTTNLMTKDEIADARRMAAQGWAPREPMTMRMLDEIERLQEENAEQKLRAKNNNAEARAFEALHDGAVKERDELRARLGIEHPVARMEREEADRKKDPVLQAAMGLIEVLQGETDVRFRSIAEIEEAVEARREYLLPAINIVCRITWRHGDSTVWLVKMRDENEELIFSVSAPLSDCEDMDDIERVVTEQWERWREAKEARAT